MPPSVAADRVGAEHPRIRNPPTRNLPTEVGRLDTGRPKPAPRPMRRAIVGSVLLVPRLADRYPVFGVVADIEQVGRLPGGAPAAVLRAGDPGQDRRRRDRPRRRPLGRGRAGADEPGDRARPRARRRVQGAGRRRSCSAATPGRSSTRSSRSPTRPSWPTLAGWAPYLDARAEASSCWRPPTSRTRLELLIDWTREHLAELEVAEKIRDDVREGMEQEPARVPAAPAARRDPQGARRGRARRRRRLPHPGRGGRPAREGPRGRAARGRASWSGPATSPPRPAGSGPGWTPCWSCRGTSATDGHHRHRRRARRCSTPTTTAWTT